MNEQNYFRDKICVITGAASGLGLATSKALLGRGATVVMADRNDELLTTSFQELGEAGKRARTAHLDVTKEREVGQVLQNTVAEFGRLDILFNNAGVGATLPIENATLEFWEKVVNINLWGVIYGVPAAIPIMKKQRSGHIVNTSSLAGIIPFPYQAVYAATKFAVAGMSECLRHELKADGIAVSTVCPGDVATRIYSTGVDGEKLDNKPPSYAIPVDEAAGYILAGVERREGLIILPPGLLKLWDTYRKDSATAEKFLADMAAERRKNILEKGRYY